MTAPEAALKTAIRKYLTERGIYWASIQNGFGAKPGDPDLVCCIDGKFVAFEVKTLMGRQSDIQKEREKQIRDNGGWYCIVRTFEEFESWIDFFRL